MLVNPHTKKSVDEYLDTPFHSLLITGPEYSGKSDILSHIVETITGSNIDAYPYKIVIDGQNDGIDQIRDIKKEFSYKFVSKNSEHIRLVVIYSLNAISRESHNALLKILEEPPEATYIIALSEDYSSLPTTIKSRMKHIRTLPIDEATAIEYLDTDGVGSDEAKKIWLKSTGLAGKIIDQSHTTNDESAELAKKILTSKIYDRLILINDIVKLDKPVQLATIQSIIDILYFKLSRSLDNSEDSKKLMHSIKRSQKSVQLLNENINPKLIWLDLSINL